MPSLKQFPDILLTETLWDGFYSDGVSENIFDELAELSAASVEVMTHPAYIDDEIRGISSYLEKREEELEILTNLAVPHWVTLL